MRTKLLLPILIALIGVRLSLPTAAIGQTFVYAQECISSVNNATVHIPADANPSLPDGTPVEAGDTLAVYTEEGICAGYGVWEDGEGTTFATAGSDAVDISTDGYSRGEFLKFEVFDVSTGRAAEVGSGATFAPCDSTGSPICAEGKYAHGTLHEVTDFQADSTPSITQSLTLTDGWNFISVPVQTDQSFETLLPECSNGFFYTPEEGYTAINSDESLPAGKGAAVQCDADTTSVAGMAASPAIEVEAGWNLIGAVEDTVAVDAVTASPSGILESDFFKLPPGKGYEPAAELHPGAGYWVKTTEAGTLNVSGGSAPLASTPKTTASDGAEANRLVFEDASGRQSTLWLKEEMTQEQRSQHELPPVPPGEVFDVRFASGHRAASIASDEELGESATEYRVELQGVDFPVEVRLETNGANRRFALSAGEEEFTLSDERSSVQIRQSTNQFAVAIVPNPREFKLGKASPNPLRNRAQLEYALPEEVEVSIAVYDMLGRRVERLVSGTRTTGIYRTRVDASQLASGKYFVRMKAGPFQKTRPLTVVR